MWIDVVIVALLLGVGAFLNQEDWRTRSLARMRTAGNRWVKAAHDAVTHVRSKRMRLQMQPPSAGQPTQPGGGPPTRRGAG
jgi:hypothetical protein